MTEPSTGAEPRDGVVRIPNRFTLRQLGYLLAVADAGSIIAAAQRLHVTQTAVGSALEGVETRFGAQGSAAQ